MLEKNDSINSMNYGPLIYVERQDVRLEDHKEFFGMAPGKIVRLRYGPFAKVLEVNDINGKLSVIAEVIPEN